MSDLKLTPPLLGMLERIERNSGTLLMLAVTASGGQDGKLNKLRGAGYVVKCDHPSVTEGAWPAEALAITEAGRTALAKHRTLPQSGKIRPLGEAEVAEKKGRHRSGDKKVIFRRDGERYIVFLGDDRIGFVRRADNGTWNHVDTTMAHSGYAKTRERAGQLCAATTSAWFERARSEGHPQCQSTSRRRVRRAITPPPSGTPIDSTLLICTYSRFLATTGLP
jgi:hypothetical protein